MYNYYIVDVQWCYCLLRSDYTFTPYGASILVESGEQYGVEFFFPIVSRKYNQIIYIFPVESQIKLLFFFIQGPG